MMSSDHAFSTTTWSDVEPTRHEGTTGFALWRTRQIGETRVRMVEYSPGYDADHWCSRGHVLLVLDGELTTELDDGRLVSLSAGESYEVSSGQEAHRSRTVGGARLFIVD
jgi:quercetin dioxygenase-like cupin family protein